MIIGITSDHGGFELKRYIIENVSKLEDLTNLKIKFKDFGADNTESSDYPDFAAKVAEAYIEGEIEKGILICKTGHGMAIAVNKFKDIRASVANITESIIKGTKDDDINMLCLPSFYISETETLDVIAAFLVTEFSNEGNYKRRKEKILKIEEKNFK